MSCNPVWRVLESGAGNAAWNMAIDEAIFESLTEGLSAPTLRFYSWDQPSVSVGRFQNISKTIDITECERLGLPIVRRITGGRGIMHGSDLTISLAAPVSCLSQELSSGVLGIYNKVAHILTDAFSQLGWNVKSERYIREQSIVKRGDCMSVVSKADLITYQGTKLLGAALHRRSNFFLEQITIPFRPEWMLRNAVFTGGVLCAPDETELTFTPEVFAEALLTSLQSVGSIPWERGKLSQEEHERAEHLTHTCYNNVLWTFAGRISCDGHRGSRFTTADVP